MPAARPDWTAALDGSVDAPWALGPRRICDPAATLARIAPLAPLMGVTRLGVITGLDHIGIPVATAIRPNSRSVSVSLGKGATLVQAKIAALMEAAENFHGEDLADRFRMASHRTLAPRAAVADPRLLPRTDSCFDDDTDIPWIEGFDLLRREPCWLPAELVHTDCTLPPMPGSGHFLMSSNGLSAGNHLLEALIGATCEVIERDAVTLWKARGMRAQTATRLDPASVRDPGCRALLDRFAAAAMAVRLWDATSDIGVPVVLCEIRPEAGGAEPLSRRFRVACCHPDPVAALSGALTEAAQSRLTYISGARDDLPPADYRASATADVAAALRDALAGDAAGRDFNSIPDRSAADLGAMLRRLLGWLRDAGCERAVAVDLTRPALGIPVVRVVIPGLESPADDPRHRPGARARAAAAA